MTAFAAPRSRLLFERNLMVYRRAWMVVFSGVFEPMFYLLSLGVGLGYFIGSIGGYSYASYIAPALLASSAMNGAVYDATNVFWKLKYAKTYDAMLATPLGPTDVALGEAGWALFRGLLYSAAFIVTAAAFGLVHSYWGLATFPAAALVAFSFAGMGIGATTYMRSWQDFDLLQLVLLPMFLFSATFYPITVYPPAIQWIVRFSPLYHAVLLIRSLTLGIVGPRNLVDVAYLLGLGIVGVWIARRRVAGLLLT
ncbi:MAG: ABC transporter permease [Gaiellaceae bacterium]